MKCGSILIYPMESILCLDLLYHRMTEPYPALLQLLGHPKDDTCALGIKAASKTCGECIVTDLSQRPR